MATRLDRNVFKRRNFTVGFILANRPLVSIYPITVLVQIEHLRSEERV